MEIENEKFEKDPIIRTYIGFGLSVVFILILMIFLILFLSPKTAGIASLVAGIPLGILTARKI